MHSGNRSLKIWHNGPCPRSFAQKKLQGRQLAPPGTCLNLLLDGLCGTAVSTDAHATPLLRCFVHPNHRFPDHILPTPPQPQRLDGWPPAAGNQPSMSRVDDSKRPREDPARRGEQVPNDLPSAVNNYGPGTPLIRVPASVPMVLRDVLGLIEAPPGRMDAWKGKQRAQIAAPRPAMG